MTIRIAQRSLLLATAVAAFAAAPAAATHNGTCDGFNDPACNGRYVRDHTVQDVRDAAAPVFDIVADAMYVVDRTVQGVLCDVFGACV